MKQLPNNINAEATILSAMINDESATIQAIERLTTEDFYSRTHQIIFKNIAQLFNANKQIDIVTLIDSLSNNRELDIVGGSVFINELSDIVIGSIDINSHIDIVLEKSKLRKLIQYCKRTELSILNNSEPAENIIEYIQKGVLSIDNGKEKPYYTAQEVCKKTLKMIEYRMSPEYGKAKIVSGISKLDDIVQLERGETCIIDGRTSNGKTVLALQYAMLNCVSRNKKVIVFSMEMLVEYLAMREIARISSGNEYYSNRIPHHIVKHPARATDEQREIIAEILEELSKKDFIFDQTPNQTGQQMLAKCMQAKHQLGGLDLVVVDYLQLMRSLENKSREQQVSEFSKYMKIIATNLNVPVIGLSQVNADGSARESRALEHDADTRISVFIPRNNAELQGHDIYVAGKKVPFERIPENLGIIKVKKNRNGILSGDILVRFDGDFQQFVEWNEITDFTQGGE